MKYTWVKPNLLFQDWLEIKSRNKFEIHCTEMEVRNAEGLKQYFGDSEILKV